VISNPQRCAQAVQRSRALDRQHHRRVGPAASAVTPRAAAAVAGRGGNCRCV
jgi:hypothetical protein